MKLLFPIPKHCPHCAEENSIIEDESEGGFVCMACWRFGADPAWLECDPDNDGYRCGQVPHREHAE